MPWTLALSFHRRAILNNLVGTVLKQLHSIYQWQLQKIFLGWSLKTIKLKIKLKITPEYINITK